MLLLCINNPVYCQNNGYNINESEASYVIFQLASDDMKHDSFQLSSAAYSVMEQIHGINEQLGYNQPVLKKRTSFKMRSDEGYTTYVAIRPFDHFKAAELYAIDVANELMGDVLGEINTPFPITQSQYRECIKQKDFGEYFRYYQKWKK
jgi:hypothetical protein